MTKEEFERHIVQGQERMYRIARSHLQSEHDCLDAISEAILKAWHKLSSLRDQQYFDTWLTRILIRECRNIQRKQSRTRLVADLPETSMPTSDHEDLRQALDALPLKLRTPIVLHYMEGYGVDDIAHILRTTKGSICSRLHEARKQMRQLLKEDI